MESNRCELMQTDPALGILRLAALSAAKDGELDEETLEIMFEQVEKGGLSLLDPVQIWAEILPGLMARRPSNMLRSLYEAGALHEILPEISALFGVPQIAGDPPQVDIGHHLLRVLDETARCGAPIQVRFAALVMNAGKSDSPPEHLPVHYRHVDRAIPRIRMIGGRFGLADECVDFALLALSESERVHRVSEVRAGPIAAVLERLGAFDNLARFRLLMMLCACDYRAYGASGDYPKAILLEAALDACRRIDEENMGSDALREARAAAIAEAFHSERWSKRFP